MAIHHYKLKMQSLDMGRNLFTVAEKTEVNSSNHAPAQSKSKEAAYQSTSMKPNRNVNLTGDQESV